MMVSDCCNVPMVGSMVDLEICPSCMEHCECVRDDSMDAVECDYIPGFDDGEAT